MIDETAPFLRAVGITDEHGRIKPTARAKHRQVERFVEILSHTLEDANEGTRATARRSAPSTSAAAQAC